MEQMPSTDPVQIDVLRGRHTAILCTPADLNNVSCTWHPRVLEHLRVVAATRCHWRVLSSFNVPVRPELLCDQVVHGCLSTGIPQHASIVKVIVGLCYQRLTCRAQAFRGRFTRIVLLHIDQNESGSFLNSRHLSLETRCLILAN